MKIPLNKPEFFLQESFADDREQHSATHGSGDGPFSKKAAGILSEVSGGGRALLTPSCTAALEMTALLLDLRPGDEVIMPSFTFVSTANAYVLRGATPVFVDSRPDTLNIDESKIEAAITDRTKAIVVVHYAGVGCEMDEILRIAGKHGLAVIEDNAHGLFGKYRERPLGSFGAFATLSFHETKNFPCGEGGALIVNDDSFFDRAEMIREKGTNRSQFFKGAVDKYTWVDIGSSFLLSDILASVLHTQLEKAEEIQAKRKAVWSGYHSGLSEWATQAGATLPVIPDHCEPAWHLFQMLLPCGDDRDDLMKFLNGKEIGATFHYIPLHSSPKGLEVGRADDGCPVATDASERLLRLPFYTGMTESEQKRVIESLFEWRK